MASHPSHDERQLGLRQQELRRELRRQRLPESYIARLLSELDDHFEDLLEERSTSMGAARKLQTEIESHDDVEERLGQPTQLALFAAQQYHARSFWGRHPLLTYLLAPLPLLVACWIFFGLAFWAVGSVISYTLSVIGERFFGWTEQTFANPGEYIWIQAMMIAFMCWYVIVVPPLTAGWLLCRTYRRNALDWRWPILACTLLAVVSGMFTTKYTIATEPGNGLFMIGFDFGTSTAWLLRFLPKFALAMGIGLLMVKRAQQQMVGET
jgi:hypothetical protein